jgi:hypothetical protein
MDRAPVRGQLGSNLNIFTFVQFRFAAAQAGVLSIR